MLKEKKTSGKDTLLSGLYFTLFSLMFAMHSFLQIMQISVVPFLQSLLEQVLSFLGVGAWSAAAALIKIFAFFWSASVGSSLTLCMNILELMLELQRACK